MLRHSQNLFSKIAHLQALPPTDHTDNTKKNPMTSQTRRWWLKYYPPNVPHEVDVTRIATLNDLIDAAFAKYSTRPMATCLGKTMTFAEVDTLSRDFAAWLQSTGLKPGARVALMMPNLQQYTIAILAVLRAGYVVVNVNPLYTPRELEHQLVDSDAEAIVILDQFAKTLETVIANTAVKHVVTTGVGDFLGFPKAQLTRLVMRYVKKALPDFSLPGALRFNDVLSLGREHSFTRPTVVRDDIAFLQYTGGTTGISKGAMLTHANIISQVLISEAWLNPALSDPRKGAPPEIFTVICALPMYHIYSLAACLWLGMHVGGHNILIPNPRDVDGMVKTIGKYRFHLLPAVNTMFNALLNHASFRQLDFSELRISNGGGSAVQRAVAEGWMSLTHTPIVEGYGLTETCAGATCNEVLNDTYTGDVGLPLPNIDIAIRDDYDSEVPLGQPGEICIRGPQVMKGYWKRDDETAKVMASDGYFKSGDIGIMLPNGHVKIVDRKKDMILVSGFNVYPNEIEDVVASCPGVLECAAIGIPDEKSGEAVRLVIVKKDPALTEETVMAYCRKNLTAYKCPKSVVFRDAMPKSAVGKILRRELRSLT